MRCVIVGLMCCFLLACSKTTQAPPAIEETKAPPPDESRKFPLADQVSTKIVPDHLLGKKFLPGGNLAEYKSGAQTYQVFLIHAPDAQKAAFLLTDWRDALTKPEYLASMGGYYGMDNGTPVYVFAKGAYLAGWVGLTKEKADVLARQLAAKL